MGWAAIALLVVFIIAIYCCYNFCGSGDDGKGFGELDVETAATTNTGLPITPLPSNVANYEYHNAAFEPPAPSMSAWRLQAAVVTLQRVSADESYGFALNSDMQGRTVIGKIKAGSPADGRLKLEDILTSVNDTLVDEMSPADVQAVVTEQVCKTSVTLALQTRVLVQEGASHGGTPSHPGSYYGPIDGSLPLHQEDFARMLQLEADATAGMDSTRI